MVKIELKVNIDLSELNEWEVKVQNKENGESVKEYERNFKTEDECMEYITDLAKSQKHTIEFI